MGKHVWTHLTDDDKAELLKRYHHLSNVDALQVGMKLPTLKRRLREMRSAGNVNHSSHIKVVTSHQRVHRRSRIRNRNLTLYRPVHKIIAPRREQSEK